MFLWNLLDVISYNFLAQLSKFSFRVTSWALLFNSKHFRDFPEVSLFPKILKQLVGQLEHSIHGDKNLVPFQLWIREAMRKPEKVFLYFVQDWTYFLEHLRATDSAQS